jgi:hemolysin activation/secretion protein
MRQKQKTQKKQKQKQKQKKKKQKKQKKLKKQESQKMRIHADELQGLKNRQINTPTSLQCCNIAMLHCCNLAILRFCRTKSLSSSHIFVVLSVKFQHFDLLHREFSHFWNKFLH